MSERFGEIIARSRTLKAKHEERKKERKKKSTVIVYKKAKDKICEQDISRHIKILMDYGRVWKRISVLWFELAFEMLID